MLDFMKKTIKNKNVIVFGAGISGVGASKLAHHLGAKVTLIDDNKNIHIEKLLPLGIKLKLGDTNFNLENFNLAVISPGIDCRKNNLIKLISLNKIPIVSEIEFASWYTKGKIIAVTGSNGKSTVVNILKEIIQQYNKNTFLGGNIGIAFSLNVLKEIKKEFKNTIHILEISSFQLENIVAFKPDIACILNISKDHLSRYNNFKNYYETKFKIFNNNPFSIYNGDDKILNSHFKQDSKKIAYSINNDSIYKINKNKIIHKKDDKIILDLNKTKLFGKHNLSNIFATIHISRKLNTSYDIIKKGIYNFKPLEHRMEIVNVNNKKIIINDSKGTNLYSTIAAINTFDENIILILGGYSKSKINKEILNQIIKKKNILYIISYGQIGEKINLIINSYKKSNYIYDFNDAIVEAIKYSKKNEVILFSPGFKSFDQFKNFEERGNKFKEIIKKHYSA